MSIPFISPRSCGMGFSTKMGDHAVAAQRGREVGAVAGGDALGAQLGHRVRATGHRRDQVAHVIENPVQRLACVARGRTPGDGGPVQQVTDRQVTEQFRRPAHPKPGAIVDGRQFRDAERLSCPRTLSHRQHVTRRQQWRVRVVAERMILLAEQGITQYEHAPRIAGESPPGRCDLGAAEREHAGVAVARAAQDNVVAFVQQVAENDAGCSRDHGNQVFVPRLCVNCDERTGFDNDIAGGAVVRYTGGARREQLAHGAPDSTGDADQREPRRVRVVH
ncbi:MAG: hypothetical protein M5U09_16500 [Gammaproteobacteria bacterium]|nr:hypothetical protein [Gammaproteobacteria bacterium]